MLGAGQENIKLRGYEAAGNISPVGVYTWNTGTLAWEKQVPISASGGGGAVTIADGADVAEGARADVAYISGSGSVIAILKGIFGKIAALGQATMANSAPVVIASNQTAVPISAAALPLPTGAATLAAQTQPGVDIGDVTINNAVGAAAVNIQDGGNSITVDGTVTTSPPANASTDLTRIAGTAASVNSGVKDNGTLRVVLATDQPPLTNKLLVTPDSVALPANQSVNVSQFGANNVATGVGASGVGVPRVTVANDSAIIVGAGDVDHDVINTLKVVQVGGNASPVDVPPAAVSANGDRARIWVDKFGAQIVRRRKIRESYTAVFRLAEVGARLDGAGFLQVANTNKQWATLYHTAAATKEVRLQYCVVWVESWAVASQAIIELRELTGATAPATGNPAITPKPRRVGGTAAEAACLYLPTTQGSETSPNSPLKGFFVDEGIMGAVSTVNPLPQQGFTLYNSALEDDEMLPPTLPVGTAGGWAVMLRTVAGTTVRLVCEMGFTEEIP